jgi:hypothetical protein
MDRRDFLRTGVSLLMGSLFCFNSLKKALAYSNFQTTIAAQGRIALIIDDIGFCVAKARQFLGLNIPITFSVLPRLAKSEELAVILHETGHEIMLHQPMEPWEGGRDPGPGALYVGDSMNRIIRIMDENISSIPFARGVNNHMGSRFTSYEEEMQETLTVVKDKGLFFVDSLTTGDSKGYSTAKKLSIPAACRNVFLDNHLDEFAIVHQLKQLTDYALKYGYAVGIGHPFPETARALKMFLSTMNDSRITFVHASSLTLPA